MKGLRPCLDQLGEMVKHDKTLQFNNWLHHLNPPMWNKLAVKGVDNMGWSNYQHDLKQRLITSVDPIRPI